MRGKKLDIIFQLVKMLADLGALYLASIVAFALRYYVDWKGLFAPGPAPWDELYKVLPYLLLVYVCVFLLAGLYRSGIKKKDEFFLLVKANGFAFCLIFAAAFFYRGFSYSRVAAVFMLLLTTFSSVVFRIVIGTGRVLLSGSGGAKEPQPKNPPEASVLAQTSGSSAIGKPEHGRPLAAGPEVAEAESRKKSPAGPESGKDNVVAESDKYQPVIRVKNACVRYKAFKSRRKNLREALFRSVLRRDERIDVWALRDVSFEVGPGESLGVIGENGAGKSTLCLLLSKIMSPTSGTVEVAGAVSALLSLGAGFQMDLTGRDNIFLNGVYMGFTLEQMRSKFHEILEFSGIKDYIDMPVRTYSSGMRARLAFSIAAIVEPEIMIIDELMGVGDMKFRQKSTKRMKEMINKSKALVVVSHSMQTIRSLCNRAVWLDNGRLKAEGAVEEVISQYEAS